MSKLALFGGKKVRLKPFPSYPVIGKEERALVEKVLKSGLMSGFVAKAGESFLGGPSVRSLEERFCKYFGVKYAIAVNSATAGLHAAISSLGIGPGDEVIVTPYTMCASASAILMANAIPVFADIKEDTFCLDPQKIKQAITPRTKAIVVVHLFGQPADMDEIMEIARKHRLKVIEDCAQAPGARYKARFAGTIGDAGVFSFNQHKTITTGEGGVVITDNKSIADKVRLVRNHGEVVGSNLLGWNYRMTELEAAIGIAQFKRLDYLNDYRIELADYLSREMKKKHFPGIEMPVAYPWNKHVYFVYPMKFKREEVGVERESFIKALTAEGIPFGEGYVKPIYLEPIYQDLLCYGRNGCPFKCPMYKGKIKYHKGLCPVTEKMHEKELIITGICRYPVKKKDVRDVVFAFEKIFGNAKQLKAKEKSG